MTYLSKIYENQHSIMLATEQVALDCMHAAYNLAAPALPQEPDFVAMLTMHGAPQLQALLSGILKGTGISSTTTGVFCHQTPKAKFIDDDGIEKRCELGDILLAHIHSKGGKVQNRNAMLLQAKMAKDADKAGGYTIPGSEHHQLALYSKWPKFEYYRAGPTLNTQTRTVFPHQAHPGAQYLLIDPADYFNPKKYSLPPANHYPCAVWMAEPVLYPYQTMSQAVFGLLSFSSGRVFGSRSKMHFGWTRVVWDLLESSLIKAFNRRNIGVTNEDRVSGAKPDELALYCTFSKGQFGRSTVENVLNTDISRNLGMDGNDLPPEGRFGDQRDDDDEGYVSVFLIETHEE